MISVGEEFFRLCQDAYEALADCEPHYVDEDGRAHVVVSNELIERCKDEKWQNEIDEAKNREEI